MNDMPTKNFMKELLMRVIMKFNIRQFFKVFERERLINNKKKIMSPEMKIYHYL